MNTHSLQLKDIEGASKSSTARESTPNIIQSISVMYGICNISPIRIACMALAKLLALVPGLLEAFYPSLVWMLSVSHELPAILLRTKQVGFPLFPTLAAA
jgi:hypothetical protein